MTSDDPKLGHPKQSVNYDLSQDPKEARRDGIAAPSLQTINSDRKNPEDLMRQLGFEPTKHMTPLQFLLAVMNDDLNAVFKNETRRKRMEGKGGISMQYRLDAAKTASKYIHMEQPKMQVASATETGFGQELQKQISSGVSRVIQRETIIREIERISPDIPLAPASYPPEFLASIVEQDDQDLMEGDMDYDPDRDDSEYDATE